MPDCRPDIAPHVAEVIRRLPPEVKRGVKAAIRALSRDPGIGEPLKRELAGFRKYRVKRFRIVYAVEHSRKVIRIAAVGHRKSVYEELAESVRPKPIESP